MSETERDLPSHARSVTRVVLSVLPTGSDVTRALAPSGSVPTKRTKLEPVPTVAIHAYPDLERRGLRIELDGGGNAHIYFAGRIVGTLPSDASDVHTYPERLIIPAAGASERVVAKFATGVELVIHPGSPIALDVSDSPLNAVAPSLDFPSVLLPIHDADPWLRLEAIELLERGGSLAAAIAAGTIMRLSELNERDRAFLDSLGTMVAPPPEPLIAWFDACPTALTEAVERAAMDALSPLTTSLQRCLEPSTPGEAAVQVAVVRDELEGVAWLLAGIERPTLAAALRQLDARFGRQIAAAHRGAADSHERLRRAAMSQPDAWWTELACSEEDPWPGP